MLLALGFGAAHAQDSPVTPLRLMIPFVPGGANDVIGRISALKITEAEFNKNIDLAQETIIQNLIDRELVIKEFRKVKPGMKEVRRIPDNCQAPSR
mgnify:CR=1 FL=1